MFFYLTLLLLPSLVLSSTDVYLYSHSESYSSPSASLAQFLNLDAFESPDGYAKDGKQVALGQSQPFVARLNGKSKVIMLEVDAENDIVPQNLNGLKPTRLFSNDEPSRLVQRYVSVAPEVYFTVQNPPKRGPRKSSFSSVQADPHLREMNQIQSFIASEGNSRFGAFYVASIRDAMDKYGKGSSIYELAVKDLDVMMKMAILADYDVVLLLPSTSSPLKKRQPPQTPFPLPSLPDSAPIFSTSTCFSSEEVCQNATSSCSSRGSCVGATRAGKTCFVCSCRKAPVQEGGKNVSWAGDMCEKQDISLQFTLLGGTVIFLILIVVGSIALLYSIGTVELPGTLTATTTTRLKSD